MLGKVINRYLNLLTRLQRLQVVDQSLELYGTRMVKVNNVALCKAEVRSVPVIVVNAQDSNVTHHDLGGKRRN